MHTVLPDPASDRVTIAMSTGGVYVSEDGGAEVGAPQPGHHGDLRARPSCPSTASACTRSPSTRAAPTGCTRRTTSASSAPTTPGSPGRRSPTGCPPTSASRSSPRRTRPAPPGSCRSSPTCSGCRRTAGCASTAPATPGRPGPNWATGLPDGAWTAVLRDAFCADEADPTGIYLGTRDGCVYASADEGDTFTLVADHLPDVLTVRAAQLP